MKVSPAFSKAAGSQGRALSRIPQDAKSPIETRCPTRESTKPKTQAPSADGANFPFSVHGLAEQVGHSLTGKYPTGVFSKSARLTKRPSPKGTVFSLSPLSPLLPHPNPFPIRNPFSLSKPTFSYAPSTPNHNIPRPVSLYFFNTSALKQLQAYPLNDAINCARIEPRGVISAEGVTNNERKRKV